VDREDELGVALHLPVARIVDAPGQAHAMQRDLARACAQHRPLAFDPLNDRKAEGLAIEARQAFDILHIEDDTIEGEIHRGTPCRNNACRVARVADNATDAGMTAPFWIRSGVLYRAVVAGDAALLLADHRRGWRAP